ncbi:TPA: restriction endonuclease subunit S [Staphylococcus aureus]|nr:restriction endonuclease subunit S [Staphylococcus aureus]
MTNEVKKVPQLRFPNFGGEWEEKQLGDVTKTNQGLQIAISDRKTKYEKGLYFYITNEFLRPNSQTKYYIENPPESVVAEKSDILMTRTGNTGKVITNVEGAFHNNFFKIKYNKSIIDRLFLFELLKSPKINNKFLSLAGTSTIPDLNHSDFYSVYISFPTISEQQKISTFFSKLDRQIELEEQKLEKLKEQKKGYMQQIFSQELRFKDEDGNDYTEWKTKKLDELGEFNSGVGFPEKYQGGNTGVPFFKVSDMNLLGNEKFMNTANNYVSIEQIKQKKWKVIQSVPAIIFAKVGAAIMLNRKRMILNPFLIDNNTMSYSFSNHWDTNFGYVVFQMLNLPKYAQVGALPSYNSKDIGIIQIRLPIKEEQEKIGDFFSKLDEHITKQSQKIDGLKLRKQGFLQKMFI